MSRKTGSRRTQDQLIRLAAFENPEFYRAQAMRLPTSAKPRLICVGEGFDDSRLDTTMFTRAVPVLTRMNGKRLAGYRAMG